MLKRSTYKDYVCEELSMRVEQLKPKPSVLHGVSFKRFRVHTVMQFWDLQVDVNG